MSFDEVMINDWVRETRIYSPIETNQIGQLSEAFQIGTIRYDDVQNKEFEYTDIYPIPLTKEFFLLNGFNQVGFSGKSSFIKNVGDVKIVYHTNPSSNYVLNIGGVLIPRSLASIKSVHELQHALRLFGLKDEANSFKVEEPVNIKLISSISQLKVDMIITAKSN